MQNNGSTLFDMLNGMDYQPIPEKFNQFIYDFQEMQTIYNSAIKEIRTKLEILNDEFQMKKKRNPIQNIKCRVKTPRSIIEKLSRKSNEITICSAKEKLNDIAGVRVTCSFIEDIYFIAGLLKAQDDIKVIKEVDYIQNPKPNGYRSFHLVLEIPVFFSERKELVRIEIQIRTIAMDFWASLEHQLNYKAAGNIPDYIKEELKNCAEIISTTDMKMQNIHQEVDNLYKK